MYMVYINHKKAWLKSEAPVEVLENIQRKSKSMFGIISLEIPVEDEKGRSYVDKRVLMYGNNNRQANCLCEYSCETNS